MFFFTTFFRNQSILRFDVILQHDWPIELCLLHIRFSLAGKRRNHVLIFSFIGWWIKWRTLTEVKVIRKSLYREKYMRERHKRGDAWAIFAARLRGLFHSSTDGYWACSQAGETVKYPSALNKLLKSRIFSFTLKLYKKRHWNQRKTER